MTKPAPPRIMLIIGSGETAAQMTRVHRSVIRRLAGPNGAPRDVNAVIVDTPFGFQENADELGAQLVDFFGRRLGTRALLASLRRSDVEILDRETALSRIRDADYVFSGPGSPSYAVTHWLSAGLDEILARKLREGGAIAFASAAALTLGRFVVPVYEIYKAGQDPHWLPGLDILGTIGIDAAVVPHFDNHEGRGHDTRFCFLGERRLHELEDQLPKGVSIVGIDEHTALELDLGEELATVHGRGSVTLRQEGMPRTYPAGSRFPLGEMRTTRDREPGQGRNTGLATVVAQEPAVDESKALAQRALELKGQVAALNERAGLADALVNTLVRVRAESRDRGDYATADLIRERLVALGLELHDNADGSTSFVPAADEIAG